MQELECSSVGDDALLVVDLFVYCEGLEYVFPQHILPVDIVEVIVVNSRGRKDVIGVLLDVAVVYVLEDELAEFGDEDVNVFHDFVQVVVHHLLNDVLLSEGVAAEHISDTAQ